MKNDTNVFKYLLYATYLIICCINILRDTQEKEIQFLLQTNTLRDKKV